MMKKFLLFIIVALSIQTYGQVRENWCGQVEEDEKLIKKDPSIIERRAALQDFTEQFLKNKDRDEERIIIPVVFHVLHEWGPEMISYEDCQRGLDVMNDDYNALNADLGTVISEFEPIIGNANFEFRLAKVDPDGNCTNGVVYYETELTNDATNNLKFEIQNWDPSSYLNIWTVRSIESGAAAWSHLPGVSPVYDGVVSIYTYVGSGHTLSHEVGHYLNLDHPWGQSNDPNIATNCNMDDYVDDTPETIGSPIGACNLNQVSCGSLDNVQNIMDYSSCDAMFTAGQTARMRAALNSSVSDRNELWTEANLMATGVSDSYEDPGCAPVVLIKSKLRSTCPNKAIDFKDYSYGEIANWAWAFEGGSPATSADEDPSISYTEPGLYDVSLTVSNDAGESSVSFEDMVFVANTNMGIVAPQLVDMEDQDFPYYNNNPFLTWMFEDAGDDNWQPRQAGNSNTAMAIRNRYNDYGTINKLITPNIDLSNVTNPEYIYFDVAFAQRSSSTTDELRVFVSDDCGESWIMKIVKNGASLATASGYVTSDFVPEENEWNTIGINISNYADSEHLKLLFQMESRGGNYLYIDNLTVGGEVSVKNNAVSVINYGVYPNPASDKLNVEYHLLKEQKVSLEITNFMGQVVYAKEHNSTIGDNVTSIDLNNMNLTDGIYAVTITANTSKSTKKLVIKR